MGLPRLTPQDIDLLAELLVRAVSLNAPIHKDKDGKGPKHCPVCIWEDAAYLDHDSKDNIKHGNYTNTNPS